MKKIVALLVLFAAVVLAYAPQRSPLRSAWRKVRGTRASAATRPPLGSQADPDAITDDFLQEAWVVLLPVSRQRPDDDGNLVGVGQADAAMTDLQSKARTRADWLIYEQISDYSLGKLMQSKAHGASNAAVLQDPDACVSATMAAMRNRVLHARLLECKRVNVSTKPLP